MLEFGTFSRTVNDRPYEWMTINSYYKAKAALNELLVAEKEWLPNFAETIAALENGEEPKN